MTFKYHEKNTNKSTRKAQWALISYKKSEEMLYNSLDFGHMSRLQYPVKEIQVFRF
jgi:hypothetical protein